jgi:hypothetical protein
MLQVHWMFENKCTCRMRQVHDGEPETRFHFSNFERGTQETRQSSLFFIIPFTPALWCAHAGGVKQIGFCSGFTSTMAEHRLRDATF